MDWIDNLLVNKTQKDFVQSQNLTIQVSVDSTKESVTKDIL